MVIIDEIQESAEIYNRIREFTRRLESDFIVTGSYLGRILNKEFRYSAGDMAALEIIRLFTNESRRYFDDILDYEAYGNLFCSIARVLVKEKNNELQYPAFPCKRQYAWRHRRPGLHGTGLWDFKVLAVEKRIAAIR